MAQVPAFIMPTTRAQSIQLTNDSGDEKIVFFGGMNKDRNPITQVAITLQQKQSSTPQVILKSPPWLFKVASFEPSSLKWELLEPLPVPGEKSSTNYFPVEITILVQH